MVGDNQFTYVSNRVDNTRYKGMSALLFKVCIYFKECTIISRNTVRI